MINAFLPVSKILVLIINATGIALVITVSTGKLRKLLKLIFASMTILMFIWVDLAFLARLVDQTELGLLYIRLAWSVTPLLFVLLYAFIATFLRIVRQHRYYIFPSLLVSFAFLYIIPFTNLIISNIYYIEGILEIEYGQYVWLFFGQVAFYTLVSFYLLIRQYTKKDIENEIKTRIKFLLGGLTLFFVANAIFNIAFPVFFRIFHLYEFGDYSLIIFLSIIAYAVTTNQFSRVEVVTATFLASLLGALLLLDTIIFSVDIEQIITKYIIFVLYLPFGYLLVSNVKKEIEQKEQLEDLTKKLKHLDNVKNEFISVAAHELRAPLTAIKGYLSMILDGDAGKISQQAKEFLQDSSLSNERMIRLVNNMLDVGRIEDGRIVYQEGYANVSELMRRAYSEFKLEAERKELELKLELNESVEDRVYVDPDRLHEVVVNFLSNALKYTEQGWVALRIKNPREGWIRAEISDSGVGITKKEQKKLFRKFYRISSEAGKTIGSGLGLYVSKLLMEKFGGKIGVESEFGKGSTFWFELPVSRGDSSIKEDVTGATKEKSTDH